MSPAPEQPHPAVGRPFRGGIIVSTTGRKWGLVEMPDGRRVVHDISEVIAATSAEATPPSSRRRLLALARPTDLSDDAAIEAFAQRFLEQLMDAHDAAQTQRRRHIDGISDDDGLA